MSGASSVTVTLVLAFAISSVTFTVATVSVHNHARGGLRYIRERLSATTRSGESTESCRCRGPPRAFAGGSSKREHRQGPEMPHGCRLASRSEHAGGETD